MAAELGSKRGKEHPIRHRGVYASNLGHAVQAAKQEISEWREIDTS